MNKKLIELINKAKKYKMSLKELKDQSISFAYGNTAYENKFITKEMIELWINHLKK